MKVGGYWGALARVDLSEESTKVEKIPREVFLDFMGAKGMAAHYLCNELEPHIDPLSPSNKLIICVGPFQGTPIPSTGRFVVCTKSPLTGIFLDSYAGGNFAHSFKKCGYDILIVEASAHDPVYIMIEDGSVEIKDADFLWGKGTRETEDLLREREGKDINVVSAGPAGENLVRIACLISDWRRAAGRGGTGAVFGSKNLKAIVARGSKEVPVRDKEGLLGIIKSMRKSIHEEREKGYSFYTYGTSDTLEDASERDRLPTRNFRSAEFEYAQKISGEAIHSKFKVKQVPCCPCPIACFGAIEGGKDRPEYETLSMLGSQAGNSDIDSIIEGNELCNDLGLDTISTGGAIGFIMECSEKGLISERFSFGNSKDVLNLIGLIARREGVGDMLAEGVLRASKKIGSEAEKIAVQVKGLEIPAWDPRGKLGHGLAYMTADIGGSHLREAYSTEKIPNVSALEVVGDMIKGQNENVARDNYILCAFALGPISHEMARRAYETVTGIPLSEERMMEISERIWNLVRMFNVGEGISRKDDALPYRLMREPLPSGVAKGCKAFLSDQDMERALDAYYEKRGWDQKGVPKKETLKRYGLL